MDHKHHRYGEVKTRLTIEAKLQFAAPLAWATATAGQPSPPLSTPANEAKSVLAHPADKRKQAGEPQIMHRKTALENVRRFFAIASLFRQAAVSRDTRNAVMDGGATEPDQVILAQLESYFWRAERRQGAW